METGYAFKKDLFGKNKSRRNGTRKKRMNE